jgi:peroxiredoxin
MATWKKTAGRETHHKLEYMKLWRFMVAFVIGAALASGAREELTVAQAAARLEQLMPKIPARVGAQFRVLAAEALKEHHPDLAAQFVRAALDDVKGRESIEPELLSALASAAPDETIALLPHLKLNSDAVVISALLQSNRVRQAADLFRASTQKGSPRFGMPMIFRALGNESPEEAKKLFADMLAGFSYDEATPLQLLDVINCAVAAAPFAPDLSAGVFEQILAVVSRADYGKNPAGGGLSGTFQAGSSKISTENSRDTLLVVAGGRLLALSPDRFAKYDDVLSKWGLNGPLVVSRIKIGGSGLIRKREQTPESWISERMSKLRGMPDADRPRAVLELAQAILALPKGVKFGLASNLANLATEGDNGKEAMDAVAAALGAGIEESAPTARGYIELAKLVRYEHAKAPLSDPSLDAADALLALRARVYQDSKFSLVSLDGKNYSLDKLRGKVVLLNFWATWCPPCRKEMPDMEALYQRFQKKGLVVLAVSDEDRETVTGFLAKTNYTFPVLLDPGREVNKAYGIEGIPKSFIFDSKGTLVTLAIDMRTERQFLDLLKEAGLQ